MKSFLLKHKWLVFLISLSIIGYWRWISFQVFFHGDAGYYTYEGLISRLLPSSIDSGGFGGLDLTLSRYPTLLIQSIFALLFHVGSGVGDKIIYLWPFIIVMPVSAYYLMYQITKDDRASAVAGLVFAFNTYFLAISTEGQELISIAGGYCVLAMALFYDGFLNDKKYKIILSAVALALAGTYDFRIVYIFMAVSFIGGIFYRKELLQKKSKSFVLLSIGVAVYIGLSLYWLLPLANSSSLTSNDLFGQNLFGGQYWNLSAALTAFHPFWSFPKPTWFHANPTPIYMYLVPLIALSSMVIVKRRKIYIFFLALSLIGVLLSKQTAEPFGQVYTWLYVHLPGFNAFREATKFYVLIVLGYAILIASIITNTKRKIYKISGIYFGYVVVLLCIFLAAYNIFPYFSGEIGTISIARHEPTDYSILQNFLDHQGTVRTLWVPNSTRWITSTSKNPKVEATDLVSTLNTTSKDYGSLPSIEGYKDLFTNKYESGVLRNTNIKYYIVPLRDSPNDDDFIRLHGDDRGDFLSILNGVSWLKPINIGTKLVKVYENKNYSSYFSFNSNPYSIGNEDRPDDYANFLSKAKISDDVNYVKKSDSISSGQLADVTGVKDLFENISQGDIKNYSIQSDSNAAVNTAKRKSILYADINRPFFEYNINNATINFSSRTDNGIKINGKTIGGLNANLISSTKLNSTDPYSFSIGDKLYSINNYDKESRAIGYTNEHINLFSSGNDNLLNDGSFEDGLWQKKVQDCNPYNSKPIISMTTSNAFHTEGSKSLELGSSSHVACTSSNAININASNHYSLRYDYKIVNGQRAGYDLIFNDIKKSIVSADQTKDESQNGHLYINFQPPAGATNVRLRLKGYGNDHSSKYALTYYDNVNIQVLNQISVISDGYTPVYSQIPLEPYDTVKAISSFKPNNVIINSGFKYGLWQKKVGDCNNYDDDPKLRMRIDGTGTRNFSRTLELGAERHIACTSPKDSAVSEGYNYLLRFDYQNATSNSGGYSLRFDDANGTSLSKSLVAPDTGWHNYSQLVHIPFGATKVHLTYYSYSNSTKPGYQVNKYRNFNFIKLPEINNRYYSLSEPEHELQQPAAINIVANNSTYKKVKIIKAKSNFYLNMSETYSTNWILKSGSLRLDGSTRSSALSEHSKLNNLLNTWYINTEKICKIKGSICTKNVDGSWNITLVLQYKPQKYMNVGLILGAATLSVCMIYFCYYFYHSMIKK